MLRDHFQTVAWGIHTVLGVELESLTHVLSLSNGKKF